MKRVILLLLIVILPCYAEDKILEISWGNSMYQKEYPKATSLFYHPNDWSSFQTGISIDNIDSYAGFFGITFNLPRIKRKTKGPQN